MWDNLAHPKKETTTKQTKTKKKRKKIQERNTHAILQIHNLRVRIFTYTHCTLNDELSRYPLSWLSSKESQCIGIYATINYLLTMVLIIIYNDAHDTVICVMSMSILCTTIMQQFSCIFIYNKIFNGIIDTFVFRFILQVNSLLQGFCIYVNSFLLLNSFLIYL